MNLLVLQRRLGGLLWCGLWFLPWLAWGHVQISGTRVIYPANAREVTLELTNKGNTPPLWCRCGWMPVIAVSVPVRRPFLS